MPLFEGVFCKMPSLLDTPIRYFLKDAFSDQQIKLSDFVGKKLKMTWTGGIFCLSCQKKTTKTFQDGYCYSCFQNSPLCSECIIFPERCKAHLGQGRNVAWEIEHHAQPHFVYLAVSSKIKVGITRVTQLPTRWIDQGTHQAIVLLETVHRFGAGQIEVELKKHYPDKTPWQKMLKNEVLMDWDLGKEREKAFAFLPETWQKENPKSLLPAQILQYPVIDYPQKVSSFAPSLSPLIFQLNGIKGQYLLTDLGVINVRKYGGYQMRVEEFGEE